MKSVFYTGGGFVPVDSTIPHVGQIFAVEPDGKLRWYFYGGHGADDLKSWEPNSGNQIGHGWENFRNVFTMPRAGHVSPPPAITIYAVDGNGDLHWYSYHGAGEKDPSGTVG